MDWMSETFRQVKHMILLGDLKIAEHGYDELANDHILVPDAVSGLENAQVVEDYPDYPKGPCVLVLEHDREGKPMHILWGIPTGASSPAVLITAYRPDPAKWTDDCKRRRL